MVGNLDYFFEQAGGTYPYDVWLRVSPDADYESIVRDANSRGLGVVNWDAPLLDVARDQRQPERQGLFGVLSVGFLAAIFLTVLGFFLYSFFSFRRRFVELGVLRAIGLSSLQMTRFPGMGIALFDFYWDHCRNRTGHCGQQFIYTLPSNWRGHDGSIPSVCG